MRRLIVLAFILCGTAGCASLFTSASSTRIGESYPPRPPGAPLQLFSVRTPDCPFEEIALVRASVDFLSRQAAVEALKSKARRLGADAVVGLTDKPPTKDQGPGVRGTAIHFTDRNCLH